MQPLKFKKLIKNKKDLQIFFIIIGLFFVITCFNSVKAAPTINTEVKTSDAVAIRILPNVQHYGIERWYSEQGFSGSPQYLIVDGYEAIRDGRTVYVNAANVNGTKIHTNIYLISYNQDSQSGTVDALAQIIANWKFNNNLPGTGNCAYTVAPTSTCLIDSDCLGIGFCSSQKSKITRDVKRLAVLSEIQDALRRYKNLNNKYPDLPTGTYVPHLSVSTWPSWQGTLAPQLGLDKSLIDPINKIGPCPDFDATTCWNKDLSTTDIKIELEKIILPNNSLVMVYNSLRSGDAYKLCATMEATGYDTEDGVLLRSACDAGVGTPATGSGLSFEALNLKGELNKEFNGYVKISNSNGDPLTWSLVNGGATTIGAFGSLPVLLDTNNPNEKKIYSSKALKEGKFPIDINVKNNRNGLSIATSTYIVIGGSQARIEAENSEFILNKNKLVHSFYIYDNLVPDGALPRYFLQLNGAEQTKPTLLNTPVTSNTSNKLSLKIEQVERGKFKLTIFQLDSEPIIKGIANVPETVLKYSVTLEKFTGGFVANKDFSITLKQDVPVFDYKCEENVRRYDNYNCSIKVSNSSNHDISYTLTGLSGTSLLENRSVKNVISIYGKVLGIKPSPPDITNMGMREDNDRGATLNKDQANSGSLRQRLLGLYNGAIGGVVFKIPNTNKTGGEDTVPTGNFNNPRPDSEEFQNFKALPNSSLFLPILKSISFFKDSFKVGVVLAEKDGKPTCQTDLDVRNQFLHEIESLDETRPGFTAPNNVFTITVEATNEYGASSTSSFKLRVNSYCGDGTKQAPNQEGGGGAYNDGTEECDGLAGVAFSAASSSPSTQYSCTTLATSTTPNPITSNDACRVTGGYCGDGLCGESDETYSTDDIYEKYDPGNSDGNYCHEDCGFCGDGIIQRDKDEMCDPADPFSFESDLGERCNKRCQIVRELKILQILPSTNGVGSISAKGILDSLGNEYKYFRNSVAINDSNASEAAVDYQVEAPLIDDFNNNSTFYLPITNRLGKYNLLILGFSSSSLGDLSNNARLSLESFIQNGGMVVFGRNSITGLVSFSRSFPFGPNRRFNYLSTYVGIDSDYPSAKISSAVQPINASSALSKTQVFDLPKTQFAVNAFYSGYKLKAEGSTCGPQCSGNTCRTSDSTLLLNWYDGVRQTNQGVTPTQPTSWTSSCNRVGLMQLSADNQSDLKVEEYKVFGNLIYHLSTLVSGDNF